MDACRPSFRGQLQGKIPPFFSDDFAYSAGDLVGQGGWEEYDGNLSPVVVPGQGVRVKTPGTSSNAVVVPVPRQVPNFAGPYTVTLDVAGFGVGAADVQYASVTWVAPGGSASLLLALAHNGVGLINNWQFLVNGTYQEGAIPFFAAGAQTLTLQVNEAGDVILSNQAGILYLGNVGPGTDAPFETGRLGMDDFNVANNLRVKSLLAKNELL